MPTLFAHDTPTSALDTNIHVTARKIWFFTSSFAKYLLWRRLWCFFIFIGGKDILSPWGYSLTIGEKDGDLEPCTAALARLFLHSAVMASRFAACC